ncbi:MAG: polysaccharide export protein [Gammaproteobacteria bacterium]|nr:MAG: polysaccharide export protein [Gammaproteobacteria bacterium]
MRETIRGLLGLFLVFLSFQSLADEMYRIQPGDVLFVSVWDEEQLQREELVRPDGGFSYPLVGDVQAAGKSVPELTEEIKKRLSKYIPNPVVTIEIHKLDGNRIYVIGKVNRPGEFPVTRDVDVVQALAMAGGMTPYAATGKIKILRRERGKQVAIPFDYGDIEKGRHLEQNIILRPGDVVVVP